MKVKGTFLRYDDGGEVRPSILEIRSLDNPDNITILISIDNLQGRKFSYELKNLFNHTSTGTVIEIEFDNSKYFTTYKADLTTYLRIGDKEVILP